MEDKSKLILVLKDPIEEIEVDEEEIEVAEEEEVDLIEEDEEVEEEEEEIEEEEEETLTCHITILPLKRELLVGSKELKNHCEFRIDILM